MSIWGNIKKKGLKDVLNPKKWGIFARYLKNRALKREYPELSIPHKREQIVWRMRKCPECVENGACTVCECRSPELFYDGKNWCSGHRWGVMKETAEEWEAQKKLDDITISEKHLKQLDKYGKLKWN